MLIADLHIHSRFSRATSKDLSIDNLEKYAKIKGINLLGTGDISHDLWLKELKEKLVEGEKGIFITKNGFKFVLSGEISLAYTQGKGRRVHLVYLAPDFEVNKQINDFLSKKGRRDYDGRPIFGLSCIEFAEELMNISKDIEIIPAHIWTPWFGVMGSMSGFDSLDEAFGDKVDFIHAIETGMSSDPAMNWRIKELNNKSIVSFSDAHSFWPWRIGRESTIFDNKQNFAYKDLISQIRNNDFNGTIETDPYYGKYHFDGHRICKFSCSPEKTKELDGICPVCGKQITIGVENRIEHLADFPVGFKPKNAKLFYKILPLQEVISLAKSTTLSSKKTWDVYNQLINSFKTEFNILLNVTEKDLLEVLPKELKLVELILRNREGKIKVCPGYDGEYGKPIFNENEKITEHKSPQKILNEF